MARNDTAAFTGRITKLDAEIAAQVVTFHILTTEQLQLLKERTAP